jgi:putative acetyltransferase
MDSPKTYSAWRWSQRLGAVNEPDEPLQPTLAAEPNGQREPAGGTLMSIVPGDLDDPRVRALLEQHVTSARAATAPGSAHALDLEALTAPELKFWAAWDEDALLGVGALKRLANDHGEIKSMHTVPAYRRRGVGSAILLHIIDAARAMGMSRLSLETGSWEYFAPARALYKRHGFVECPPFGEYVPDPNSVFMSLDLREKSDRGALE